MPRHRSELRLLEPFGQMSKKAQEKLAQPSRTERRHLELAIAISLGKVSLAPRKRHSLAKRRQSTNVWHMEENHSQEVSDETNEQGRNKDDVQPRCFGAVNAESCGQEAIDKTEVQKNDKENLSERCVGAVDGESCSQEIMKKIKGHNTENLNDATNTESCSFVSEMDNSGQMDVTEDTKLQDASDANRNQKVLNETEPTFCDTSDADNLNDMIDLVAMEESSDEEALAEAKTEEIVSHKVKNSLPVIRTVDTEDEDFEPTTDLFLDLVKEVTEENRQGKQQKTPNRKVTSGQRMLSPSPPPPPLPPPPWLSAPRGPRKRFRIYMCEICDRRCRGTETFKKHMYWHLKDLDMTQDDFAYYYNTELFRCFGYF